MASEGWRADCIIRAAGRSARGSGGGARSDGRAGISGGGRCDQRPRSSALNRRDLKKFGRIDGLVNNAGYATRGPLEIVPVEAIRKNFETNVFALIALTQLVVPVMRAQGSGCIVNIGSVAGRIARPLSSIYDATKHALEAITDGLRGELQPFGIRVALIQPVLF